MNVATHQKKEKNEKMSKREAGEERRQATDFKECMLPFRGQHSKKMVCVRKLLGVTVILGKANSHFDSTQTGLGIAPPH